MAVPQQRQLTLQKFLKLPEEKPALEYVHGVVTQKVPPKAHHSVLQYALSELVNTSCRPLRIAYAFPELRTTFAGASVVPDVAVFTWERIARDARGQLVNDVFEPPDIAIEIVSPGQRIAQQVEHCAWYVGNGVRIALMVNPRDSSVTVFRPDEPPVVLRGAAAIDVVDVLPGFELTVDTLFAALKFD